MIELLLSILGTLCAAGIKIACEQYFKSRYEGEIREEVQSCFWWRKSRQDDRKKRYMRVSMINSDEWDVDDDDDKKKIEETGTKEKGDNRDKENINTQTEMVECQTGDSLINNNTNMSRIKEDTLFLDAESNCTTTSNDDSSRDSDSDSDSDSSDCNNGSQEELVSLINN